MSAAVTFVPDEMRGFAAEADGWAVALREEARDLDAALDRFRASSSEYVPAIPDHAGRIDGLAERMSSLAEAVGTLAAAAEQADREGVRLHDLLLTVGNSVRYADKVAGMTESGLRLIQMGAYGALRALHASRLAALRRRWGVRSMPDIGAVRQSIPGGPDLPRSQVRPRQIAQYRANKRIRAAALRNHNNAVQAMRTRRPLTTFGQRVQHFLHNTRAGRVVTRAGRVLGGVGVALGAYDAITQFRTGQYEDSAISGMSALGGFVLLVAVTPVGIGIGAGLVVGALILENREWIGEQVGGVAEGVADAGRSVIEGAASVLGDLF